MLALACFEATHKLSVQQLPEVRKKLRPAAARNPPGKELVAASMAGVKSSLRGHELGHEMLRSLSVFRELIPFEAKLLAAGKCWIVCDYIFHTKCLPLKSNLTWPLWMASPIRWT